jgi:predicted small secreted protein
MGSKTITLRDNRLKSFTSNKSSRINIKGSYVQFKKIVKISSLLFNEQINKKIQGIQIVIVFTFFVDYLAN